MLGDYQSQGLRCLKPCQLTVLISRVTFTIVTNSWCDFKCLSVWAWLPVALAEGSKNFFSLLSLLPEPAAHVVALAPSTAMLLPAHCSTAPFCLTPRKAAEL